MHSGRDVVGGGWSASMPWFDLGEGLAESRDPFSFGKEAKRVKLTVNLRVPVSKILTLVKGIPR